MLKHTSMALFAAITVLGCAPRGHVAAPAAPHAALASVSPKVSVASAIAADAGNALSTEPQARASAFAFAHVIHDGGVRVLLDAAPDEAWAVSDPKLVSKGSPIVVRRDVDLAKLPVSLASSVGRRVELMRAGERVCEATITGLSLIGRVEPYFGVRADWDGSGEPGKKPLRAEDIADEAWKMSDPNGHAVAAELGNLKGDGCGVATWARDVEAPRARVAKATPASDELSKRAVLALHKLDAYAEIQTAYEVSESRKKAAPWETAEETELVVSEMSFGRGEASWVWVSARTRESCGPFYGELSALFELREGPLGQELALRYEERAAPGSDPEAALLPGAGDDGRVDVLFMGARLHPVSQRYQLDAAIVPYLDCPC